MHNKHLFLSPELLSRLIFSQPSPGVYYVQSVSSQKPMRAFPEEIIRQLVILSLIHQYHYPEQRVGIEYPVQMGRTKKRADLVVFGETGSVDVVVEVKQRIDSDAIEQLKSYVMVTGAGYGLAVSGLEYICFKKDAGNHFVEVADIPFCGKDGDGRFYPSHAYIQRSSSTAALRTSLQVENFEKIDRSRVRVTIQGCSLDMPISELASFRKVQKRFLSAGVVLAIEVKQSVWLPFIRDLLAEAPPPTSVAPPSLEDKWKNKIGDWIRALPLERTFLTSRDIATEVLNETNRHLDRRMTLRIAKIMRALGWQRGVKRVDGTMTRGYLRGVGEDVNPSIIGDLA